MVAISHPFTLSRAPGTAAGRKRPADPTTSPEHIRVVRVNSAWIVHSSLEDDPVVARPPTSRRVAGRR